MAHMKKIITFLAALGLIAMGGQALAQPARVPAVVNPSGQSVIIPAHAAEVAPGVFSLGETIDEQSGKTVSGYAIVHYADGHAKPDNPGGGKGGSKGSKGSTCYGFLAKGAKWKSVEPWMANTTNPDGLSGASVFAVLSGGIAKWEDAADGSIDGNGIDILGNGTSTAALLEADTVSTDGANEVYFDLLEEGTIGVTIVWGTFGGPPSQRELVEWDQVYNTSYGWSLSGDPLKMDFDNIATHELGHSTGLGDLYTAECAEETMYGYGTEGETKKRDLNTGDIAGISELYR